MLHTNTGLHGPQRVEEHTAAPQNDALQTPLATACTLTQPRTALQPQRRPISDRRLAGCCWSATNVGS